MSEIERFLYESGSISQPRKRHDFNLGLICSCLGKYSQLDLQSLKRQLIYLTWVCEFEGNKKEVAEQETMGKKTKCFQNIDINSNVAMAHVIMKTYIIMFFAK